MSYAIDPATQPTLPVLDSDELFPIRRVFCVGRNYADHAREMGADPNREPPFFFMKPADAVFAPDSDGVPYPPQTDALEHEIELVVAIGVGGSAIAPEDALHHVWGYSVGVDLTRRDLQAVAKELRRPWDLAKGFDYSGPCSALVRPAQVGHPDHGRIWLSVDGVERQAGDLADQIWPVDEIIAALSCSVTLAAGDLIFTGTPAGVGRLERGSRVDGGIDGIGRIAFTIG